MGHNGKNKNRWAGNRRKGRAMKERKDEERKEREGQKREGEKWDAKERNGGEQRNGRGHIACFLSNSSLYLKDFATFKKIPRLYGDPHPLGEGLLKLTGFGLGFGPR